MNPESTIQNLGIRIANDAITIASLEAQVGALRSEIDRLSNEQPPSEG